MNRIVNFRSFVYSALMISFTSLSCLIALNIPCLGFCMLLIDLLVPGLLASVFRVRMANHVFVTVIMTTILCFVAAIMFFVTVYTWVPYELDHNEYKVVGEYDASYMSYDDRIVILRNVKLNDKDMSGKMLLTVRGDSDKLMTITYGDKLTFYATVNSMIVFEGFEVWANNVKANTRYSARIDFDDMAIEHGEPSIGDKLEMRIKGLLNDSMGEKYGGVAYGMLTGDKNDISFYTRDLFANAGIAHILAVSGLHIGVLMAFITFLLQRFKVKRLLALIIDAVILIFYIIIADFSPSVIRASIMFMLGGGAMLLGEQNDGLNALGFSMTVILTAAPIMLFDVGFIMSSGAVFGLIVFIPPIEKALKFIRMPDFAAKAIAASTAAELGILPPSIAFFGTLPLWAIFVNIVLMPLMTFAFILLFVALIISLVIPTKALLSMASIPIRGMIVAAEYVTLSPLAYINALASKWAYAAYPIYFAISGFVNVKRKHLLVSIGIILLSLGLFVLFLLA